MGSGKEIGSFTFGLTSFPGHSQFYLAAVEKFFYVAMRKIR